MGKTFRPWLMVSAGHVLVHDRRKRPTMYGRGWVYCLACASSRPTRGDTPMPGKAAKVVITERQRDILDEFRRSRCEPSFLTQRSTVILLAFTGMLNEQIASQVGLERH